MTKRPRKQLDISAADSETIGRLINVAGSEQELSRLTEIMRQRRGGRLRGSRFDDYDTQVLYIAEYLARATGQSFHAMIKIILGEGPLRFTWPERGANPKAVLQRIYEKRQDDQLAFEKLTKEERDKLERELSDWFDWIDSLDDPLRTDLQTDILKAFKVFSAKATS